jgi:hypothetical protein
MLRRRRGRRVREWGEAFILMNLVRQGKLTGRAGAGCPVSGMGGKRCLPGKKVSARAF